MSYGGLWLEAFCCCFVVVVVLYMYTSVLVSFRVLLFVVCVIAVAWLAY